MLFNFICISCYNSKKNKAEGECIKPYGAGRKIPHLDSVCFLSLVGIFLSSFHAQGNTKSIFRLLKALLKYHKLQILFLGLTRKKETPNPNASNIWNWFPNFWSSNNASLEIWFRFLVIRTTPGKLRTHVKLYFLFLVVHSSFGLLSRSFTILSE